jgi:hypothetical protein
VLHDALDQRDGVLRHRRVAEGEPLAQRRQRVAVALTGFVQDVERALARLAACSHYLSFTRPR